MSVPLRIEHVALLDQAYQKPLRRRRAASPAKRLVGIGAFCALLSVIGLAGVGAVTILQGITCPSSLRLVGSASTTGLAAVMGSARRANGYVTVSGSVSNIGLSRTANIEAVVELIDSQNRTVQVDKSLIAFSSVAAGDSSPFRVIVPDDGQATGYRLTFTHPDGRVVQ